MLFFERLTHKSELLCNSLTQKHNIVEMLNSVVPDGLVMVCQVSCMLHDSITSDNKLQARAKLARFSILTKRFAANLRHCSPEIFLRMGGVYRELSGIEKKLDGFVEQLKKDDLSEAECSRDLDKLADSE